MFYKRWGEKDDGKTLKNARVKFSFGEVDGGGRGCSV